jgi:DNA modification methylase
MVDMDQSNGHITTTQYSISDLIFAEYNPRELTKDQHQDLKDSITRFGLVDPLIVNIHKERKNILVGGHQRLKIAKELGYKSVSCVEVELTPEKERELNIRLNKNTGQWDWDALANHFDVGELTEWGFTNDDLQFYVDEPLPGLIDEDEIPEVEEAVTQAGDMWLLGEHKVLCGDATKKEDVERLMDGQKADMVFTDPPYGINRADGFDGFGGFGKPIARKKYKGGWDDERPPKELFIALPTMADKVLIFGGNYFADLLPQGNHWVVWDKKNTMPTFGDCELIWTNIKRDSVKIKEFVYNGLIGKEKERFHATQKPIQLLVELLDEYESENGIVLDTFLGSGSTLIACEKTNRKCYGMELDPHYCDVIVKRWEEYTGNKAERIEAASA